MDLLPDIELLKTRIIPEDVSGKNSSKSLDLVNSFSNMLKEHLVDVNEKQNYAEEMNTKLVLGEVNNVHDVMIASQKASLALEMTLQIRNLILGAYQKLTMLR